MSVEVAVFLLRLLSGFILAAFLLALLYIIWRSFNQVTNALEANQLPYTKLVAISDQNGDQRLGKTFALLPITTLGRSPSNAIVVDDDYASALHASIVLEAGQWWIEDGGSRNGTQLNNQRILQRTALANGDEVRIGRCAYKLEMTR